MELSRDFKRQKGYPPSQLRVRQIAISWVKCRVLVRDFPQFCLQKASLMLYSQAHEERNGQFNHINYFLGRRIPFGSNQPGIFTEI
jgi:hypothetical protein